MELLKTLALTITFWGFTGISQAEIISAQSYSDHVVIGPDEVDSSILFERNPRQPLAPHSSEQSSVTLLGIDDSNQIPFALFQYGKEIDTNGVYRIFSNEMASSNGKPILEDIGSFSFKQIEGQDTYFGEWSNNSSTRTVYYSGKTGRRKLPNTKATYLVDGINNYDGDNLLSGDLLASFDDATQTLSGLLTYGALNVSLTAKINSNDLNFIGDAQVRNPITNEVVSTGTVEGTFFGRRHTCSLVGIAKFDNSDYDTAFGGTLRPLIE